jgi:nephrocystin-3
VNYKSNSIKRLAYLFTWKQEIGIISENIAIFVTNIPVMSEDYYHHKEKQPEFRLFLSSTFRDLQPEREQLIKKVFPQIRAICRERGVEFTEIDLRWGITDEEARTGNTIRICLEEIDKCRPYFLGIIGSRYGWVPDASIFDRDPALRQDYPWLGSYIEEKKSITEMEFSHGAILRSNKLSAHIYEQIIERDLTNAEAITLLHDRIIAAGIPHRRFNTPHDFGEQVLLDLIAILDRDFPQKKEFTAAERERNPHEAFARNRTHSYIADPEYSQLFEKFVNDTQPLILWGKSGFGKSALMAHLTSDYKHHHPEAFIIRHFVGATSGASSAEDVMQHVMLEIKERYNLTDELPQSNLLEEFPIWLAKIPEGEKLILAIDAVNQLTGIGNEMHWLPEFIPAYVRLIISTTAELPLEQLRKRQWPELQINPLSESQRKRITEEFLARYHKHLDREQLELIASESKLLSPLFLRTLLEELRIFGHHETLGSYLASYLDSENEAQLFQKVLARMEKDHGDETVRNIMTAIWASRFGLSETELLGITKLTRLALSQFLIALEFHLMRRTGLFTFFHNYLREAVESRYLSSDEDKKAVHKRIAEYFSGQEYTERRSNEEPYQWIESDEREKLLEMFGDSNLFLLLGVPERHYELLGYWNAIEAHDEMNRVYSAMYQRAKNELSLKEQAALFTMLGSFLTAASRLDLAEEVLTEAVTISQKIYGDDHKETANALRELATVFLHKSKNAEAADTYRKAITVFENIGDLKELSETQSNLAVTYYNLGKFEESIRIQRVSVEIATRVYGKVHPIVSIHLNNLASILFQFGSSDEAEEIWKSVIEIDKKTYGKSHPLTIRHEISLALLLVSNKEYRVGKSILQSALDALIKSLGERHSIIANIYSELSQVLMHLEEFKEAEKNCIRAIDIYISLFGADHILVIRGFCRLARIAFQADRYEVAQHYYEIYLPKLLEKLSIGHPDVITVAGRYLEVLTKLNQREGIEKLLVQFPSLR